MFKKILVCVAIALFSAYSVHSLECYACNGDLNSDCAKGINMTMVQCDSQYETVCVAHDIESPPLRLVTRSCFEKTEPDLCAVLEDDTNIILHACKVCDVDYCNRNLS